MGQWLWTGNVDNLSKYRKLQAQIRDWYVYTYSQNIVNMH